MYSSRAQFFHPVHLSTFLLASNLNTILHKKDISIFLLLNCTTVVDAFFSRLFHFVEVESPFRTKTCLDFFEILFSSSVANLFLMNVLVSSAVCLRFRTLFELLRGAVFGNGRMSDRLQSVDLLNTG